MEAQKRKAEAAAAAAEAEDGGGSRERVAPAGSSRGRPGGTSVRPVKLKELQLDPVQKRP